MAIRMLAQDLYQLVQEVEKIEKELGNASPDKRAVLEDNLRKLRAQRDRLRGALEGCKEPPPYRQPR
jgi:ABC-type Zn uptake system ZnuABC Zn-binding protein ZnuA